MSKTKKQALGFLGEQYIKSLFIKKGFIFLFQNYKIRYGEIDLIFENPKTKQIIFIEVKTRRLSNQSNHGNSLSYKKIMSLQNAYQFFCAKYQKEDWVSYLAVVKVSSNNFIHSYYLLPL